MNESGRLSELEAYQILDTSPEKELDDIVALACAICNVPTSMITLIASERAWFKARKGLSLQEATREYAFCSLALDCQQDIVVIPDSTQDARFKENPLVLDEPHIRFYAGVPLRTPSGYVLGSLCITHTQPRKLLNHQKRALQLLANKAMNYLVARKLLLEQTAVMESPTPQVDSLVRQMPGADKKECARMVEQILFDISHTIRQPLSTLMGLTNIIQTQPLDDESYQQLLKHLKTVSQEMDARIRGLNRTYLDIQSSLDHQRHVS